jgi:hypothetical protein
MARTTKKEAGAAVAASTPQEQFAVLVEKYKNLPKGDTNAFKGTEPTGQASAYQKLVLDKYGVAYTDTTTKLDAHASMKAFEELNPEKAAAIKAERDADIAKAKADAPAKTGAETKKVGKGPYRVNEESADKPASYHQIIQLAEAGIRPYNDTSPMPTQRQVTDVLNALYEAEPDSYNGALTRANDRKTAWSHQKPTANQEAFAKAAGIKVLKPFVPAKGNQTQYGSTAFSVGSAIHELKTTDPEKYNSVKVELETAKETREKIKTVVTSPEQKKKLSEMLRNAAIERSEAGKGLGTGGIPVPGDTQLGDTQLGS